MRPQSSSPAAQHLGLAAALALLACLAAPAGATVVSGQVTDPSGGPLAGVDLDFVDTVTGMVLPTINDDTDLLGFYAVDVPPGTYDIQYEPPAGVRFVAFEAGGIVVSGATLTRDQVLQPGFLVAARVLDPALLPIDGGRVDVRDSATGAGLFSHLDRAGADGVLQPIVPAGTWDFKFGPAVPGELLSDLRAGVVISGDLDFGDVVLTRAFDVTGRVVGSDGPVLVDAHVVAVDATSGQPADGLSDVRTDLTGAYRLFLPAGAFRLEVEAAFGEPYAPRGVHGLVLSGGRALPDIVLDRAATVRGTVIDERGAGIELVDVDFREKHSNLGVRTPGDDTDPSGGWQVVVPLETYDVDFDPPPGSSYVAAQVDDVLVDGDLRLPDVVLLDGVELSGRLLDPGGAPAADVNVDVIDPATGVSIELTGDRTDAFGTFAVFVPPGTWDARFAPPALSGWGAARRAAVPVPAATDLGDVALPGAVTPTVTGVAPASGPEAGGTLVTITGDGFEPGARALAGGRYLKGVVVLDPQTLQGTTRSHHRGLVDVEVVNPGAAAVGLPDSYAHARTGGEPVLRLRRDGALGTDVFLDWTAVNGPGWAVHRSQQPWDLGTDRLVRETGRTTWRDEGAGLLPGLHVYVVH
jgi:hypothetical protein